MSMFWTSLLQALLQVVPEVWRDIRRGDEDMAKRRLHERLDREVNIAIAKQRLKERQANK